MLFNSLEIGLSRASLTTERLPYQLTPTRRYADTPRQRCFWLRLRRAVVFSTLRFSLFSKNTNGSLSVTIGTAATLESWLLRSSTTRNA